ncbi:MAG: quinone-dependent dihydroorotate dehydrogenase [gamma proteobacterium symbiont of Bathyaustriella thionipta]|nr:quinone-dependent dihydroorotate dehydrogenase [gamma proteobacterium symbiont of Bathyaustriella thionipta]MCU7950814.1 quinone-dependent dihydroorotate dehydrogenase [gamma proteobacterium symbiont of Bathyaustriella thionipta]MCU7953374.1 quinone-dependent dihydroorotate dehydrogenase [gamma proteobacterium symbiont of Bathyaustriella thionipta]MCU7957326.1 quinone-dependent dihydroorotate dehydrogenase [gamma proteobacterium symbiont of Bathyaustriella thionipta]MCU7967817.1 quinone-depe
MSYIYPLIRRFFFSIDAEKAHMLGLKALKLLHSLKLSAIIFGKPVSAPRKVMGLTFPNAVGLAAGLDKNGDYIDALSAVGFGFIEIGTITPRPQPGNPPPRLFRIPEAQAIINRMGFNNKGVEHLIEQVKNASRDAIIGINIGKNFDTPVESAADDYKICLQRVYSLADYITINISSPNTPGLRTLQFGDELKHLLEVLKSEQKILADSTQKYVPLAVKIAPDMEDDDICLIADLLVEKGIDAVIATNTTISRSTVKGLVNAEEQGGLSGVPVKRQSTHVVRILAEQLKGKIPVIAAGGIFSAQDAQDKISAGAELVQIYTGFIYKGNQLIKECAAALK